MTSDTRYPNDLGFEWGQTESVVWLAGPNSSYKKIEPELLSVLQQLAAGDRRFSELETPLQEAIVHLEDEGFLHPGGEVQRYETSNKIRIWPKIALFGVAFLVVASFVVGRLSGIVSGPPLTAWIPPKQVVLGSGLIFAFALCHEAGHYFAAKPYFDPKISFSMLNGVFPAIVTKTNDAWRCPRSVRMWINIAGPLVDSLLTVVLLAVYLLIYPDSVFLSLVVIFEFFRLFMSLNPFIQSDGYWILVDLSGEVNLRQRGLQDLRQRNITKLSVYAAGSVLFTVFGALIMLRFLYLLLTAAI